MKGNRKISQDFENEEKQKIIKHKEEKEIILDINCPSTKKLFYFSFIIILIIFSQNKISILNHEIVPSTTNIIINDNQNKPFEDPKDRLRKVRVAIYAHRISNGGVERLTALLANYLSTFEIFDVYLFLNSKSNNEYKINKNIHIVMIYIHSTQILKRKLMQNKIDVLIYQYYILKDIQMLNSLKEIKTIFYNHCSFLYWIYDNNYHFYKTLYNAYRESKYIVSLVPLENDFLFKKWGINSILMNNLMPFEYNDVTPSDLSSKTILMIGRGEDIMKRFDLGIKAMKYIVKEVPDCEMKIISSLKGLKDLKNLIKELNLENNIKFEGYTSYPEKYYKNASLHLFPSLTESFGLVLSETKLYGIPNILVGLDYVSCAKGGVSIIYDDKPESIAKEAIKILKDEKYRKKMGKEARESMKKFNNELTVKKWVKLILSVYLDEIYYHKLREQDGEQIGGKEAIKILRNQVKLLRLRVDKMKNVTVNNLMNFTYMKELYKLKGNGFYYYLDNFF